VTLSSVAEEFAVGYALATTSYPVGLTERALCACQAAERVAEGLTDPGGVPSLLLGQLEGIWAVIYSRREELEKAHAGAFKKVLEALSKLDWTSIVAAVETQALIDPSITGDMLASELRTRVGNMIVGDLPANDRAAWQQVMSSVVADGAAEGQTAATGILAQQAGASIDWELAAKEAKAALAGGTALGDSADAWIQQQTQGLGYAVSQKLAALWNAGASKQEMLDAIQAILDSPDNVANAILDTALGQSISMGSVATYLNAGVPYADFITAGDNRVCSVCASAEDGNPYAIQSVPIPGLHIRCRCAIAPSDFFPTSLSLVGSEDA
jgi:SPP1 gp7 family putative phage head morphogenesis protein